METLFAKHFYSIECRIIFFQTLRKADTSQLHKAITTTFPNVNIVAHASHKGLLIEKKTACSLNKLEQIALLTTLHDDLPIEITFFYLPFRLVDETFLTNLPQLEEIFNYLLEHDHYTPVFTLASAFFKMYRKHEQTYYHFLAKFLLAPILTDTELLHTVKIYIENFSNATVTAKKQFIHRNGLLYRLNKFWQKTEIDLKNYQESVATYLAIISLH